MADQSQLSAEAIASEIESLRQQMRSFALQRAEGLIDATLQRDLVADLKARIVDLENRQNIADESPAKSSHAEAQMVDEMLTADATDTEPDEDTHEHPDVLPVSKVSTKLEHTQAHSIDGFLAEDEADTTESAEAEETVKSDEPNRTETQRVQEVMTVEAPDAETDEEMHEQLKVLPISEASNEPEHAQAHDRDDIITEEAHNPLRRDEDASLTLGDFVEDVVISSAMVKEPDYLDSIHEPNVVDIRDITKTYQMGELDLEVLKGITLQVQQGELLAIMGPSGSGKSTLMNILGALDKATAGEYFLDGVDVSKMNEKQLAEIRNQKIGFVFQSFNLLKRTSAIRQVELPLIYGKHKDRTRRAREALEAVGLGQRLDHTPAELSGGQQQRVAIARALVAEPSLILADEPTGNLDSRSGMEVMQIFQNLNRKNNITTIVVTHDVWIARHTDRVIMLRDGRIIADQRVKNPLVAGDAERPTETQELQAIFENTYYGGDDEEYT